MIYYTKSNITQKLHKKKKKNSTMQRVAGKSARRPAHSRSAHARAARAAPLLSLRVTDGRVPLVRPPPLPSLCGTLTWTPHPSALSLPRTAARPRLQSLLAWSSARARVRTSTASSSRHHCCPPLALYRLPPLRPRERRAAAIADHGPATRAR